MSYMCSGGFVDVRANFKPKNLIKNVKLTSTLGQVTVSNTKKIKI